MATINIFIPVYNGEKYLQSTINSILESSYQDFEALFVDDGSVDTSLDILRKAAAKDKRIKVFSKENQGSVPFSWNYIFKHLTAPWTLYMSHDDMLHPDLLSDLISTQICTGADCVIPSCCLFTESGDQSIFSETNRANDMSLRASGPNNVISGREAFELMFDYEIPGFALWRTDSIKRLGMPTEAFNSDEGMQRIWALNCEKVAFTGTPFFYRQRPDSIGKGVKLHHFFSVLTEEKLLRVAKQQHISSIKIHKAQYKSLFWTLWLLSYLRLHRTALEQNSQLINKTLKNAYSFFKLDLPKPTNLKEKILYIISHSKNLTYIYIWLYSKYLKHLNM